MAPTLATLQQRTATASLRQTRPCVPRLRSRQSALRVQAYRDDDTPTGYRSGPPPVQRQNAFTRRGTASEPIIRQEEEQLDGNERVRLAMERLQARWDQVSHKKTALTLVAGIVVGTYLGGAVLSNLERIPLLPIADLFTFVGLVYSATFFWRYVLFKEGREGLREQWDNLYAQLQEVVEGAPGERTQSSASSTPSGAIDLRPREITTPASASTPSTSPEDEPIKWLSEELKERDAARGESSPMSRGSASAYREQQQDGGSLVDAARAGRRE